MKANHVAFGVNDQGDESILANRKLILEYLTTIFHGACCLDGTVLTTKIYNRAAAARILAFHFNQSSGTSIAFRPPRKSQHLDDGTRQGSELDLKSLLVKRLRSFHVLNIYFKPTDWVSLIYHRCILLMVQSPPLGRRRRLTRPRPAKNRA